MNKCIFALAIGMVATSLSAQTYNEWDDVSVTHLNREKAHTVCIPLKDADAVADKAAVSIYNAAGMLVALAVASPAAKFTLAPGVYTAVSPTASHKFLIK